MSNYKRQAVLIRKMAKGDPGMAYAEPPISVGDDDPLLRLLRLHHRVEDVHDVAPDHHQERKEPIP